MFRVYSHTGGQHANAVVVHDIDDESVDAWVCPPGHPDRPVFDEAGADVVYDTIDDAYTACLCEEVDMIAASEAWQRKEGKNKNGGLNAKGRASYNRAHHGHLKAPSKDKKNKRRKSFCARMRGMKKRLTSAKTANDPNSRINKALRAWNC